MTAPTIPSRTALQSFVAMDRSLTRGEGRSSTITHFLSFIKTLSFVVGITLGLGAIFAGVWSVSHFLSHLSDKRLTVQRGNQKFLLPLLYSTFSARKAVTEQQLHAFKTIVTKLKGIRSNKIYHPIPVAFPGHHETAGRSPVTTSRNDGADEDDTGSHSSLRGAKITDSLLIEELPEDSPPTTHLITRPHQTTPLPPTLSLLTYPPTHAPSRLTALPETLTKLELYMDATSTTRTSLLSTVSAFTSSLNSQAFQFATRTRGGYGASVGMGSLDANLVKAGAKPEEAGAGAVGKQGEGGGVSVDDVKKEIRGLKGLLLSRYVDVSFPSFLVSPATTADGFRSGVISRT